MQFCLNRRLINVSVTDVWTRRFIACYV